MKSLIFRLFPTQTGSGTAIMKNGNGWQGGEWPLAAGSSWIAYVVRADVTNVNGGVVTAASSPVFTIGGDASGGGDSSGGSTLDTEAALLAARADIRNLIRGQGGDVALAAKFLRLGFHDCIGGCDGCVDLSNMENGGLLVPIQALRPVVEKYANADTGLSRADIWALATATGAAVMQGPVKVSFDLTNVGRVDCENANTVCQNEHGEVQDCSDIRGPHRVIPGVNTNSRELFEFFFNEFGFDTKEGVALMGAHTIGQLKKENTGIEGHGWMRNNDILDNGKFYYCEEWKRHLQYELKMPLVFRVLSRVDRRVEKNRFF
jgi:Peroxidase